MVSLSIYSCIICGASRERKIPFCTHCLKVATKEMGRIPQHSYPFPLTTLFSWNQSNHRFVQKLTYQMKGNGVHSLWKWFALGLVQKGDVQVLPTAVVPCPSREGAYWDHSSLFAKEVSRVLGIPLVRALRFSDASKLKQKSLSLKERKVLKFKALKEIEGPILFVDDVVTSGSTAVAAREALKSSYFFEVWAISCRE